MNKIAFAIFILAFFFSVFSPLAIQPAYAAIYIDPCQEAVDLVAEGDKRFNLCLIQDTGASKLIRNIIIGILVIVAVVSLVFLIWGGFKWVTSGGDKAKVESARGTIIAAIVGLIIAFLAYFILTIVLGLFGLKLTDLKIPKLTGDNTNITTQDCPAGTSPVRMFGGGYRCVRN